MAQAAIEYLGCPCCGLRRTARTFGVVDGVYHESLHNDPGIVAEIRHIGGRGQLSVEPVAATVNHALALRSALQTALARIDTMLVEAGVEFTDDDQAVESDGASDEGDTDSDAA